MGSDDRFGDRPSVAILPIVLRCSAHLQAKVRWVFDTLLLAAGIPAVYAPQAPLSGPWLLYAPGAEPEAAMPSTGCVPIAHCPQAWTLFDGRADAEAAGTVCGLAAVLPQRGPGFDAQTGIDFDIVANAFFFLSSWSERVPGHEAGTRQLRANSVFSRLNIAQDVVDQYLGHVRKRLQLACDRTNVERWRPVEWPNSASYALVLSHDVDFLPSGHRDIAVQGAKTVLRHLVRQRDPVDAWRAAAGWTRAVSAGRDPYGCVPELIERERELGLQASFQVAVGHRHRNDVNYYIEDDRVVDYLRVIPDSGFELCLHGSYRSTENAQWYVDEVELLTRRLQRPLGSRQHFLSFSYDTLFSAQEQAGIEYDMSMGFPDAPGPRAGFSFPYFPYCLKEDRPFRVLQISLFLMDVTLRGYLNLKAPQAWRCIEATLADLRGKGGCASAVWHPIVFGGARDPGYDSLFWRMAEHVHSTGGTACDGRSINTHWRRQAGRYASFAHQASSVS